MPDHLLHCSPDLAGVLPEAPGGCGVSGAFVQGDLIMFQKELAREFLSSGLRRTGKETKVGSGFCFFLGAQNLQ